MSHRPIIDAGPALNFLALSKERLLFKTLGALCVPEIVETEILEKAKKDARFAAAERVWRKIPQKLMTVLSDDFSKDLNYAVQRITRMPMEKRSTIRKNLGEIMVLAHASIAAEKGRPVIILMDDGDGRKLVKQEQRRLNRFQEQGKPVGDIKLISTLTVLERAANRQHIPDKNEMRQLYGRLRGLDDGLVPIEKTNLMQLECWK